jgi:hypothetical protein
VSATSEYPRAPAEGPRGWFVSLLFWLCLFLAGAMYAAVALSPKLLAWASLRDEHYGNQVRLVELEKQVKYLGRVVDALEDDPEFAAQLARVDFDASRPGDERITVDPSLSLDARDESRPRATVDRTAWYLPLLRQFADRPEFRRALLTIAAALSIFSFAFLQEAPSEGTQAPVPGPTRPAPARPAPRDVSWLEWLKRRYRR